MRSQITKLFAQRNLKSLSSRCMTTPSHPRASGFLSLKAKVEIERGEIQNSLYPTLNVPFSDVFSYGFTNIKHWGHKTFTECAVSGRKYTFNQTYDAALRWGAAIQKLLPNSVNPTIAFVCPNTPDYVTMFMGTLAAGAVVTPLNPTYTIEEIAGQLRDSEAQLLVIEAALEPMVEPVFQILGKNLPVVVVGQSAHGRPNAQELLTDPNAKMLDYEPIDPNSVAILPYSSGTTGKPKGVEITHQALVNNICQIANNDVSLCNAAFGDTQESQLGVLPFSHIFGITATMLPAAYLGHRITMVPKFDPMLLVETIKNAMITSYQIVPIVLQFLGNFPLITSEDLKSTHSIFVGSAPLSMEIVRSIKEKAPHIILQEGYGMTETLISLVTPHDNEKIGYCGRLLSGNQGKIVDMETGELLPENTPGELLIKTNSAMKGYKGNEEATNATLDEEGWIHTGDVAIHTEDGFFSIVDRIKELIKVKGLQVSPSELEETLQNHPGIYEAGVVGVPHAQNGEAPVAFVVTSDDNVSESDIHAFMGEHLAKHKQLEGGIKFVNELPKNPTGKLLRKVLKSMAMEN